MKKVLDRSYEPEDLDSLIGRQFKVSETLFSLTREDITYTVDSINGDDVKIIWERQPLTIL